jgi:predicted Zn-dependent protease
MRRSGGALPRTPAAPRAEERIRVALAPLGRPNPLVLDELRELLQYKLGVAVDVLDKPMALGQPDRTMAEQYVDGVFGNLAQRMDPKALAGILADLGHKGAGAPTYEIKKQAVTAVLRQLGSATKRERFQFFLTARKMEEQGQYSVTPIVTNMRKLYDPGKGTPHRLFMAVTDSDIYGPRTNFLYGAAVQGASVISYHRFAAAFTGEEQDRPRLVTRLVKQALSSVLYMLEIPRCDSPDCARAYSHDLHEHDRKPDQLCAKCLQALKDKLEQLLDRDRGARPKPKGPSV